MSRRKKPRRKGYKRPSGPHLPKNQDKGTKVKFNWRMKQF